MAIIKCKECNKEVSNKAASCPNCGIPIAKVKDVKVREQGWGCAQYVALFFLLIILLYNCEGPTSTSSSYSNSITRISNSAGTQKYEAPKWTTSSSIDDMTGGFSAHASSPYAYPLKKMSFPYNDVKAHIGVGCSKDNEWVYFGFNVAPNITDDETKDGYNLIRTRIRWNNVVENVTLTQTWGDKFIHFRDNRSAVLKIAASNSLLLELKWHGEQSTHFKFSLNGSAKALAKIRARCANNK